MWGGDINISQIDDYYLNINVLSSYLSTKHGLQEFTPFQGIEWKFSSTLFFIQIKLTYQKGEKWKNLS